MSEQQPPQNEAEGLALPLIIRAQYIKDFSFENPNPLQAFVMPTDGTQPSIAVDIQARAQNLGNGNYEVVLDFHIQAKREENSLFVLELSYGGLVTLGPVPEEAIEPLVMIECPHLLFPFARNILAEVTRDGGFPPLYLTPVDFAALYRQQLEQRHQEGGANSSLISPIPN